MSTKTTKPEQEQADIDLGQAYSRAELFLEKNKQAVTYGVLGLLVVVGGLLGYRKLYAEPRAKEANDLIWKAQYYFEIDSLDKAINGDGNYFGFQYIADEYGNTPATWPGSTWAPATCRRVSTRPPCPTTRMPMWRMWC